MSHKISCIVPIAAREVDLTEFLQALAAVQSCFCELIFSLEETASDQRQQIEVLLARQTWRIPLRFAVGSKGRGVQMNRGARHALGDVLFFLHCDCRFFPGALAKLTSVLSTVPGSGDVIWYHDLSFYDRGSSWLLWLTEKMANFRSRFLRLPYGDQALVISQKIFWGLGGFPENSGPGEDLRFILKAKSQGVSIRPIGTEVGTSARKYHKNGWLRITLFHQWVTISYVWQHVRSTGEPRP